MPSTHASRQSLGAPSSADTLGEWIASRVFDIELEQSAVAKAIDGHFRTDPLAGKTVNVKWYGKQEAVLDVSEEPSLDCYLVMTGPKGPPVSSRGGVRALRIDAVYLFLALDLLTTLRERGLKIGVATSVRRALWDDAEIFPRHNPSYPLTSDQRALELFAAS